MQNFRRRTVCLLAQAALFALLRTASPGRHGGPARLRQIGDPSRQGALSRFPELSQDCRSCAHPKNYMQRGTLRSTIRLRGGDAEEFDPLAPEDDIDLAALRALDGTPRSVTIHKDGRSSRKDTLPGPAGGYEPPEWGALPAEGAPLSLQVRPGSRRLSVTALLSSAIRVSSTSHALPLCQVSEDGAPIALLDLHGSASFLVGREPALCDIVLPDKTVSRCGRPRP
jgi:hypothetical protein